MNDATETKYLRVEISGTGTIEVRGNAEFVDSVSTLFVFGISQNVIHRAQRTGIEVKLETKELRKPPGKGGQK